MLRLKGGLPVDIFLISSVVDAPVEIKGSEKQSIYARELVVFSIVTDPSAIIAKFSCCLHEYTAGSDKNQ